MTIRRPPTLDALRHAAIPLGGGTGDYDDLLRLAAGRQFVLLGEATHGTHEFYAMRAEITQRLIREHGFDAVAVEADWPDAYRLNRFVQGDGVESIDQAFRDFQRFPTWMWRNQDVFAFIAWLRSHNEASLADRRVGFYGMDLYSLYRSADSVIEYLQDVDPEQAQMARRLYVGLDHVRDPQGYGYEAASGLRPPCRDQAAALLSDLVRKAPDYQLQDGEAARDEQFFAERNASVILNAERYYRTMFTGRVNSWNLRDSHMVDTLFALRRHLRSGRREGRIVVWAHNSHLGDARATQMGERGEWNVGQLLREQAGPANVLLVGFTTYTGHVTAAQDWDAPAEHRWVRPAHPDSIEHLFYRTRLDRFYLAMQPDVAQALRPALLERAIGVIYRPETEMASHYFQASVSGQFDALFHLDETSALEPLDIPSQWQVRETPDTYPFGT